MTANKHTTDSARRWVAELSVSANGMHEIREGAVNERYRPLVGYVSSYEQARLIAAAPELLEVARNCENLFMSYALDRIDGDEIADAALALIRAAIEKATGGAE